MKKLLTHGRFLMLLLLGSAGGAFAQSEAQSLGAPTTRAWLGVPLDLSVPVRFSTPDVRSDCVQAEVFYGTQRLLPSQVRTSLTGKDPLRRQVRVESDLPIDEPVVTVSVRAGCSGALTRKYTLLPDIPSEQVLASLPARAPAARESLAQLLGVDAPVAAAPAPAAPLRMARSTAPAVVGSAAAAPRASKESQQGAGPVAGARGKPVARVAAAGPRLRLEPLEWLEPDREALLRMSDALSQPSGDASRRAEAARMWQAINADPAEFMRTTEQLQVLQRDLVQVQQNAARMRGELEALRGQVAGPPAGSTPGGALQVLALIVLALGGIGAAAWARARRAGGPAAWSAPFAPLPAQPTPPAQVQPQEEPPVTATAPLQALPRAPSVPPAASAMPPEPAPAPAAQHRPDAAARVEVLAAALDEVEFLCTLGLRADAVDVLETYVQNSASPAPVAYLELMRLSALEGDHHALAAVRRRYGRVYGVASPSLERMAKPLGVEQMPALAARLVQAWQGDKAAAVIEDALFGTPDAAAPLTLRAARELLFLRELAQRLAGALPEDAPAPAASAHALAPWAHADGAEAAHAVIAAADADVMALDIDLGALAPLAEPDVVLELAPDEQHLSPLLADLRAAAREAEERADAARRAREAEEAFSRATAAERRTVRL